MERKHSRKSRKARGKEQDVESCIRPVGLVKYRGKGGPGQALLDLGLYSKDHGVLSNRVTG